MKRINWKVLIVSFAIVHLAPLLGSLATNADTDWYNSIKPAITPPSIVFPIVWTILFLLIWLSLYFAWINAKRENKIKVGAAFGINLCLNVLWSVLFFGLQNPAAAFYELLALWISIAAMMLAVRETRISLWMLAPYLLWVSFAAVLNWLIVFG